MLHLYRRVRFQLGMGRALANAHAALNELDYDELDLWLSAYAANACSTGLSKSA